MSIIGAPEVYVRKKCAHTRKIVHAREKLCMQAKNCARTRKNAYARKKLCTHTKNCVRTKKMCKRAKIIHAHKKLCTHAKNMHENPVRKGVSGQVIMHLINYS